MNISKAWLRFISTIAFTSALGSGIVALAAYGFGLSQLPPITIGSQVFVILLVGYIGWASAAVYIGSNILDAATPQVSEGFNTLGKVGSWIALALFTLTGGLVIGQMSLNTDNIRRVLDPSGSLFLIAVLWTFAVFDVFVLQRIKNRSLAHYEAAHDAGHETPHRELVRNDGAHGEIVRDMSFDQRDIVPIIGRIDNARILYFDCRGKDVTVTPSAIPGGDPIVTTSEASGHAA